MVINVRVKLIASLDSSYQAETSAAAKAENIIQEKKRKILFPIFLLKKKIVQITSMYLKVYQNVKFKILQHIVRCCFNSKVICTVSVTRILKCFYGLFFLFGWDVFPLHKLEYIFIGY